MEAAWLTRRLSGGHEGGNAIRWRPEDLARLYDAAGVSQWDTRLQTPTRSQWPAITKADTYGDRKSFSFVISDGTPDRMNDIVSLNGIRLNEYRQNPIVLLQHDSDRPVGRSTSIGVSGGKLRATVELASDISPDAAHARNLISGGILKASSIGFMPIAFDINYQRQGFDFHETALLEWSLVSVPAAPGALIEAGQVKASPEQRRRFRDMELIRLRGSP